ncbi:hypothetical protein ACM26S_23315 [Kluyvera sichuanensis]|uniref:hypothetical protein n=1 Tax=Kluyvera sichuanensis TaxID=2725494 RepID=UPI0039F6CEDB
MAYFKGTDIFFIKESIYSKSGLPTLANTIGPAGIQVLKQVYHLMYEQQALYKGEPIDYSQLEIWDKFKITFGIDIIERKKTDGKIIFNLEYSGFSTFITPIDGFGSKLPKWFSSKHKASLPTPYTFGRDPIPSVNLYRNISAKFLMGYGGTDVPCSMAKYNAKTGQLIYISSENEFLDIMRKTK